MLNRVLRRSYATLSNEAAAARTGSTPLAVRERRARRPGGSIGRTLPGSDTLTSGLTPSEYQEYIREKAKAKHGEMPSPEEWLRDVQAKRARLRGMRAVEVEVPEGKSVTVLSPVGQRVFLPNVLFRMIRNHTPKGQAYNPYEATFRIDKSLTKNDVRNYLWSVYGVQTTYVRTDIYHEARPSRSQRVRSYYQQRAANNRGGKRAVVGLVEPFYYPDAVEDMSKDDRTKFLDILERMTAKEARREQNLKQVFATIKKHADKWTWTGPLTTSRAVILRRIAERRAAREAEIERTKQDMVASRGAGKVVEAEIVEAS
ncbi:unnamed protein product [Peniophora sp. CBMAI 1063]|nr:unnamed protein product [Peniophora sp. CBMAI 1063]